MFLLWKESLGYVNDSQVDDRDALKRGSESLGYVK